MSKSNLKPYHGQCLCGKIHYDVDQIEPRMGHCHCTMCRKFHGAAFATLGEARIENFRWTVGERYLKTYTAPNGTQRLFCEYCGSSMVFKPSNDGGEMVEFSLGTLDCEIEELPDAHIFTDYRANWYDITDHLPQYAEGRDSGPKK